MIATAAISRRTVSLGRMRGRCMSVGLLCGMSRVRRGADETLPSPHRRPVPRVHEPDQVFHVRRRHDDVIPRPGQ